MENVGVVNLVLNGGALVILGYWIIWGLPKTLEDLSKMNAVLIRELVADHKEVREANERIWNRMANAVDNLSNKLDEACKMIVSSK